MRRVWKTIPQEPLYEVSNFGEVRNKETKKIKSLRHDRYGYLRVTLYPSGKTYTVHRLVLSAFHPEGLEKGLQVNHINGNKEDNRLSNLEWCDASHNAKHRDTVLQKKWTGHLNPQSKLTPDIVRRIKYGLNELSHKEVAQKLQLNYELVRRIRKGDRWSHI